MDYFWFEGVETIFSVSIVNGLKVGAHWIDGRRIN